MDGSIYMDSTIRDGPFNFHSDFGGGNFFLSDSEFLSYNLMLNSGEKFRALRDNKNKYSN